VLSIAPPPTIYLHSGAIDMRKRFDSLSGIIRGNFGGDPADGSLFLFVNKRRGRIKALWLDGDGVVLWYKRLEQGTFESVPTRTGEQRVRIDSTHMAMILGGVRLPSAIPVRELRYSLVAKGCRLRSVMLVTTLLDADRYPAPMASACRHHHSPQGYRGAPRPPLVVTSRGCENADRRFTLR